MLKKNQVGKVYKYGLLILMGMLCFSTLGTKIAQDYLHLPLSLPELFFIPLYIFLKKELKPIVLDKDTFFLLVILLVLLIIWSQVWGQFPIYSVLSTSRGYLYMFLFLCLFKSGRTDVNEEIIVVLCFGSIFGWFISSRMNFNAIVFEEEALQDYGNMIAVALFMMYTILKKQWKLFFIGFVMILGICMFSGIRRVILVAALSFAIPVIMQVLSNKKSIFKQAILVGIVVLPLVAAIPIAKSAIEDISPILYYRIFEKSERSLHGESEISDDLRKENIKKFFNSPADFLMPKGMISNQTTIDKNVGIFMDFPLTALSHMFSLPIAIIIVLFFLSRSYKCYLLYKRRKIIAAGVYGAMGGIFFVLLFVEGSFLVFPFITPMTGMCLGRILYYSHQYDKIRIPLNATLISKYNLI